MTTIQSKSGISYRMSKQLSREVSVPSSGKHPKTSEPLSMTRTGLSAAPDNSSSVGSAGGSGFGGHHCSSSEEISTSLSSSSSEQISTSLSSLSEVEGSSSEDGSWTASLALSGPGRLPARGWSWSSGAVSSCARADAHQNSVSLESPGSFFPEWPGESRQLCLSFDEPAPHLHCTVGLHTAIKAAGDFVWARSAVPSWDGTAASNSLNHMGLTTKLWLVCGFL